MFFLRKTSIFLPKIDVFTQTTVSFCQKIDHNLVFFEKNVIFLPKIAENCDRNVDPSANSSLLLLFGLLQRLQFWSH
jgi:hypothetical protein